MVLDRRHWDGYQGRKLYSSKVKELVSIDGRILREGLGQISQRECKWDLQAGVGEQLGVLRSLKRWGIHVFRHVWRL